MAKGHKKKEFNARISFIKNTLQNRLNTLKSIDTSSIENLKSAVKMLEGDLPYSHTVTISFTDCVPPGRYAKGNIKGYLKQLKQLKNKLEQTIALQNEPAENPKALHDVPLFKDTQLINWTNDGQTNQLNRLIIAINRGFKQDGKSKFNTIDDILNHIVPIWLLAKLPLPSTSESKTHYWSLLQEAITKYAEQEGLYYSATALEQNHAEEQRFDVFCKNFDEFQKNSSAKTKKPHVKPKHVNTPPIKKDSTGDIERITDSLDIYTKAKHLNKSKQEITQKVFDKILSEDSTADIFVTRLFVGSGYSGMTLMSIDPSVPESSTISFQQLENFSLEESMPLSLDTLLISEHETGHWTKAEHRAEQEHPLLEIPGNANAGDFIPLEQSIGHTKRTNTRHLFYANTVNMGLKDTPPPLFGVTVEKLEKRSNNDDWHIEGSIFEYRILISKGACKAYIYAKLVDFALGMGEGETISFQRAIQYELSKAIPTESLTDGEGKLLLKQYSTHNPEKGYTPIIHGNDFDLNDQERRPVSETKNRKVVIIGGAGGAATAYRISVLGTDAHGYRLQNEHGDFLQEGPGVSLNKNVKIFARGNVSYRNLALQATESFDYAKENKDLYEGYMLIGIKIEEHKILLNFHKKEGAMEVDKDEALQLKAKKVELVEDNGKFFILNLHQEACDQLISGMGQNASKIRALFKEIKESELEIIRGNDGHFVGLQTQCGKIRFHGAMAGTLSTRFASDMAASLEKSNLPRNGNDQNIMPCVLSKLFSFFSQGMNTNKRLCFNVNTCFLRRGDLRTAPTEFAQFLKNADLSEKEASAFIEFLLLERSKNKTGAGVSFEALKSYINESQISDRIQIVSSCSIIATKESNKTDKVRGFII